LVGTEAVVHGDVPSSGEAVLRHEHATRTKLRERPLGRPLGPPDLPRQAGDGRENVLAFVVGEVREGHRQCFLLER